MSGIAVDAAAKGVHIPAFKLQTGGKRVAAKVEQRVFRSFQRVIDGKAFDTAAGALRLAAVCCDYNAWPAIGFHQPSGDDTEHAGVPALAGHNQHAVEAALWVFIELTLHLP